MTARWPALALVLAGCTSELPRDSPHDEWDDKLADRVVDYSSALRIAALRLTGELPTLAEIHAVADQADDAGRRSRYEALVQQYLASPQFARQMFRFWQDTLKLGDAPVPDSAAAFVARIAVQNRSYLDVVTAIADTCPSFDPATSEFTSGDCANAAPEPAGLLTHPGMNAQFFSNFAFRRVRWLQETFVCTRFPAERSEVPVEVGGPAPYTGMFPFESIAGAATLGRVDFRDTKSVVCANCHSNLNHIAPLFAHFDSAGMWQPELAVPTPLPGAPLALLTDYLPPGEPLAWRHDVPVTGMASLGAAMAADPAVAECAIARLWNWALGKPDIVETLTEVPAATIQQQVDDFVAGDHRLRDAIYNIYTSDDFVRF